MKERYYEPEMKLIAWEGSVITTSLFKPGENELPPVTPTTATSINVE